MITLYTGPSGIKLYERGSSFYAMDTKPTDKDVVVLEVNENKIDRHSEWMYLVEADAVIKVK